MFGVPVTDINRKEEQIRPLRDFLSREYGGEDVL